MDFLACLMMCIGLVFFTLADSTVQPSFNLFGRFFQTKMAWVIRGTRCNTSHGTVDGVYVQKFCITKKSFNILLFPHFRMIIMLVYEIGFH